MVALSSFGGAGWQFFDNNGMPLSGGKLYTYAAGTTTPQATFTSVSGATPHANPIVLDSAGRVPGGEIWLTQGVTYKFVIETALGVLLGTYDNLSGINDLIAAEVNFTGFKGQTGVVEDLADNDGSDWIGFQQAGTGAVAISAQDKMRQFVSVKDFGAVGDGVTDDTTAVQAALDSEQPLDWGGLTYRITSTVSRAYTKNLFWQGRNATIIYDGTHTERAVFLSGSGIEGVINDLTIDGAKLCNKCLDVDNNTDGYSNLTFNNVFAIRAKRLNTFSGGSGILIRGSFNNVDFNGGGASDCELPAGQGTSGVVGINGISVNWYSVSRYVRRATLNGVLINKIYSSDLTYTSDQDGFVYFAPDISGGTSGKVESDCVIMGNCRFINCYGRAIKTQVRNSVVRDSHFERTEGPTVASLNVEIGVQSGSCIVNSCTFSYQNTQAPSTVVSPSPSTGWKTGVSIRDNEVYLASGTTLTNFVQPFPSGVTAPWSRMEVVGNKILGPVSQFVDFLTNSNKAHITVSDNWVKEIAASTLTGAPGERNLIYVRTSGSTPPEGNYAFVYAANNVYDGTQTVYLARARVTGTIMDATVSAQGNFGFVDQWDASPGSISPYSVSAIAARLTGLENTRNKGYFGMQSKIIADATTETFNFRAANASLIILQTTVSQNSYAIFSVAATTAAISVGSGIALGTTTNPGTGAFNVWRSNTGEISVQNASGTSRTVSVWVFSPN